MSVAGELTRDGWLLFAPRCSRMPFDLIEQIVKLRVTQDTAKAAAKRKKKSKTPRKPRASE